DLFQRVSSLDQFGERLVARRKINPQLRALQFPAAAMLHQFAQEFLLCLNCALDLRDLLLRNSADANLLCATVRRFGFRGSGWFHSPRLLWGVPQRRAPS